ncbi:MAG TPA: fused MFS/spermidine synthase [Micromonosporaceae bacterium]
MGRSRRAPAEVIEQIESGTARLVPDGDRPRAWTLLVDGTPQSHVDLDDPAYLEFEYMRRIASVLDTAAPPGVPLRVLHLGGGALSLARYVAATRPGSVQRVVERDAALVDLVRRQLPLPRGAEVRVRVGDARAVVERTAAARYDVVLTDVYVSGRIPSSVSTVEFARAVARVLRPGGRYAVNVADAPPLAYTRRQVATLRAVFDQVCLMAEPGVLRGRRYGNVVLVAAARDVDLRMGDLATAAARDPFPGRLLSGSDLDRFVSGSRPVTDAAATDSPAPPPGLFT